MFSLNGFDEPFPEKNHRILKGAGFFPKAQFMIVVSNAGAIVWVVK